MSTVNVIDLNGSDVQNARDVSIGGKALVDGNVTIGHNLKVEGWLEAPNIKSINKGVFIDTQTPQRTAEENLNAAYPTPQNGWIAGVVDTTNNNVKLYVARNGAWVNSGTTLPFTLDAPAISDLQSGLAEVEQVAEDGNTYPTLTFVDVVDMTTDFSPYIDGVAPVTLGRESWWEYIYWRDNEFVCKYNGSYYSKWSNDGKTLYMSREVVETGGVTVEIWHPRKRKLYIRRDGTLFYFNYQNEFVPFSVDFSQIQTQLTALDSTVENRLFINANKLLNTAQPLTFSAVLSSIDNLPDKAKYQVPGAVLTFLTEHIDGEFAARSWESWQHYMGNWNNPSNWRRYPVISIAAGETYLTKNNAGELKLSTNAKRAIDAVLNNAFSYEIIP